MDKKIIDSALAFLGNKLDSVSGFIRDLGRLQVTFNDKLDDVQKTVREKNLVVDLEKPTQAIKETTQTVKSQTVELIDSLGSIKTQNGELVQGIIASLEELKSALEGKNLSVTLDTTEQNASLKSILSELSLQTKELKKDSSGEGKKTNKLLTELVTAVSEIHLEERAEKEVDLSPVSLALERIINLIPKVDFSTLEDRLLNIEDAILKIKLEFPKTIKIDENQLRSLRGGAVLGGMVPQSGEFHTSIVDGSKTITVAGTPVALSATSVSISKVEIHSLISNAGYVYVGASTVSAVSGSERGHLIPTGASFTIFINDLNKVYVDSTTSGDKVTFLYYA